MTKIKEAWGIGSELIGKKLIVLPSVKHDFNSVYSSKYGVTADDTFTVTNTSQQDTTKIKGGTLYCVFARCDRNGVEIFGSAGRFGLK